MRRLSRTSQRSLVACSMLLLFLAFEAFCASATLHHRLHPDSTLPGHQCAITLICKGHFYHAPVEVSLPRPSGTLVTIAFGDSIVLIAVGYLLPPGRAPPSLSA
jgi:hypothetical protein